MGVHIQAIPHEEQRYPTVGDWFDDGKDLQIKVSKIPSTESPNPSYIFLVALHEFIEAFLCDKRGISERVIDEWDMAHPEEDDPGSLPGAPYNREHMFALSVEAIVAKELGVDWDAYEAAIEAMP